MERPLVTYVAVNRGRVAFDFALRARIAEAFDTALLAKARVLEIPDASGRFEFPDGAPHEAVLSVAQERETLDDSLRHAVSGLAIVSAFTVLLRIEGCPQFHDDGRFQYVLDGLAIVPA